MDLELSVFDTNFDPHNRGRRCKSHINNIRENNFPLTSEKLSTINQQKLLEYCEYLTKKIKRNEFSYSSFDKNVTEAIRFCLTLKETSLEGVTEKELSNWWNQKLTRYENGEIAWATMRKEHECVQILLKWIKGYKSNQPLTLMYCIPLPKKPKNQLAPEMPSQIEVKKLIDAVKTDGKDYTIRDQAIMALANDSGARISEILSIQNKHIKLEKNYLVVSFPESKTIPRTVISFLAKPYLENWAKISPNKDKGPEALFFCKKNGSYPCYNAIRKSFQKALKKANVPWKKGKSLHYFRSLFASRAYDWPYTLKHYWVGWAFKDHEKSYTQVGYKQCVQQYFEMIKKEDNPFTKDGTIFWEEEKLDDIIIEKLINEKPEFKVMLRKMIYQLKEESVV